VSLFLDIGTGAGLAAASGIRPYLPPLLAGALARGDLAIDFDGTDWSFLESPAFLLAVLALAVLTYAAERSGANPSSGGAGSARGEVSATRAVSVTRVVAAITGATGLVLGGLLFAGALADGRHEAWIGLLAGPACAGLAWLAVGGLVERARRRLAAGAGGLLTVYADLASLGVAALAILVPPLSFVALVGFALLLAGARRREGEKFAGLRVLR
jgi:hypothetical protein